jgi:hypothetical protein
MIFHTQRTNDIVECSRSQMAVTVGGNLPPPLQVSMAPPLPATSRLAFLTGLGGALIANQAGGTGPAGLVAATAGALNQAIGMPAAQALAGQ